MRNAARVLAGAAAAGAFVLFCGLGLAQPVPEAAAACPACCGNPQSPRTLTSPNWNWTSAVPTVSKRDGSSIDYSPRAGVRLVLHPCSQHYHCRIENVQDCPGQSGSDGGECPAQPEVGSWVEIHTAYHQGPALDPLPEDLKSCLPGSVVVVGYHARVTSGSARSPIPIHFGPPSAEWSGSSTNVDPPACKPAAFWSFTLGCGFTVSTGQLHDHFDHPDRARPLQPSDRLSRDLAHIVKPKSP